MKSTLCSSLFLIMTLGLTPVASSQDSSEFMNIIDAVEWGTTYDSFSTAMSSMFHPDGKDPGRRRRHYGGELNGHRYEFVPVFINDSLQSVLIEFEPTTEMRSWMPAVYDTLSEVLEQVLGKPRFAADAQEMSALTGSYTSLRVWSRVNKNWAIGLHLPPIGASDTDEERVTLQVLGMSDRRLMEWTSQESATGPDHVRFLALFQDGIPKSQKRTERYAPEADEFVAVEEMPVEIYHEQAVYPELAMEKKISGTVWVQALVDMDGRVQDARILKPSGTKVGFEEAALEAAYENRYKPAIQNGQPVAVWVSYKCDFKYRDLKR